MPLPPAIRRTAAPALLLTAALLLAGGTTAAQDAPDAEAVLAKVKSGTPGFDKVREKLAADPVGSRFRVDGFALNADKDLEVSGVMLVPGSTDADKDAAAAQVRDKVSAAVQDAAGAKDFKAFDFSKARAVRGERLPHIVLQKAANEAGKANPAADELKLNTSRFDAKGKLVVVGERGRSADTLKWLADNARKVLEAEDEKAGEGTKLTDKQFAVTFDEVKTPEKATVWPLSPAALRPLFAGAENPALNRVRVDRAYLVSSPARADDINPGGVAWQYAVTGIAIGNPPENTPTDPDLIRAVCDEAVGKVWGRIKDSDVGGLTNADSRANDPAPQFQKAVAARPALDGVRIEPRTGFGPDGQLVLAGLQPGLDAAQQEELDKAVRGVIATLATNPDLGGVYRKLPEHGVSTGKLARVKVRELHSDLRKWVGKELDDVRLARLYFDGNGQLTLTCEAPDAAAEAIVQRELAARAAAVVPQTKTEPAPAPKTTPKDEKKEPEVKKEPDPKKEPEPKDDKKDDKKEPDPKKDDKKEPEPKDEKKDDKKDAKDEKKEEKQEPEPKDEKKEEKQSRSAGRLATVPVAARVAGQPAQPEPPKADPAGGPRVEFRKLPAGLTRFLQQQVADPKNTEWYALLVERGYFNEKDEYTVRGVADSEDQKKKFAAYLASLKDDPRWGAYFTPIPAAEPEFEIIPMAKMEERARRVMPGYSTFDGTRVVKARYEFVTDPKNPGQRLVFDAHVVGRLDPDAPAALTGLIAADEKYYGRRLPKGRLVAIRAVPPDATATALPDDQLGDFSQGYGAHFLAKNELKKAEDWLERGILHAPHVSSVWFLSAYHNHLRNDTELVRRDLFRIIPLEDPLLFDGPAQRKRRYAAAKDLQGPPRAELEKVWLQCWKEYKDGAKPLTFAETK